MDGCDADGILLNPSNWPGLFILPYHTVNNHLLPYPYNQSKPHQFLNYDQLAESLYNLHLHANPPATQPPNLNPIRAICISDTHNSAPSTPDGDLLHTGDLTLRGSHQELQRQLKWHSTLPHPHKVAIAGSHD